MRGTKDTDGDLAAVGNEQLANLFHVGCKKETGVRQISDRQPRRVGSYIVASPSPNASHPRRDKMPAKSLLLGYFERQECGPQMDR